MIQGQKRVAIFGGSFDPPHLAHKKLLDQIQADWRFDHIWIVPSKFPPGKRPIAPYRNRLTWTEKVFNTQSYKVSSLESGYSQTVFGKDIYSRLAVDASEAEFYWILGEDQWEQLPYWHEVDSYGPELSWLIIPRSLRVERPLTGYYSRRLLKSSCRYSWARVNPMPKISSTQIREELQSSADQEPESLDWIPRRIFKDVCATYRQLKEGGKIE